MRYVSEWEVIYHEVLAITNAFRQLTKSNLGSQETKIHHELTGNYSKVFNNQVQNVLSFVRARGNPYFPTALLQLHNFVTKVRAPDNALKRLVGFYDNGKANYEVFRKERFIDKTKALMDVIKQEKHPEFIPTKKKTQKVTTKNPSADLVKEVSNFQKTIDVARSRGITMSEILQHDLFSFNRLTLTNLTNTSSLKS